MRRERGDWVGEQVSWSEMSVRVKIGASYVSTYSFMSVYLFG